MACLNHLSVARLPHSARLGGHFTEASGAFVGTGLGAPLLFYTYAWGWWLSEKRWYAILMICFAYCATYLKIGVYGKTCGRADGPKALTGPIWMGIQVNKILAFTPYPTYIYIYYLY